MKKIYNLEAMHVSCMSNCKSKWLPIHPPVLICAWKAATIKTQQNLFVTKQSMIWSSHEPAVVMGATLAPAIFKPEKNLVFFRIKSRVP